MFAGTLGRSQFFVRSCVAGFTETALLFVCIALQYEAFSGPPGEGRYRMAASAFAISVFFCFKRISFAIRRNRDAGGGDLLPGLYAIGICAALVLQTQALIVRRDDDPMHGMEYATGLSLILICAWLYLLFARSAPDAAQSSNASPGRSSFRESDTAAASHLSLAMEQAIAGTRSIPAAPVPAQPQGFLGSVRHPPPPPRRTQFGRRGVR